MTQVCTPQYTCGGQRTTFRVNPLLRPCWGRISPHGTIGQRVRDLLGSYSVPDSHLTKEVLGFQMPDTSSGFLWAVGIELRPSGLCRKCFYLLVHKEHVIVISFSSLSSLIFQWFIHLGKTYDLRLPPLSLYKRALPKFSIQLTRVH